MPKFGHIDIPDIYINSGSQSASMIEKKERYRGIFTNLLMQRILTDTISGMRTCSKCSLSDITNMVIDKVGTRASRS